MDFWPGDKQSPATVFFGTSSGKLIALNAKTGKPVPGFGNEGVVDMKPGALNGLTNSSFGLSSPPIVYKNVVITGAHVQEGPSVGAAGDTRAWDAHTGKFLWTFHSVPRPGETGIFIGATDDSRFRAFDSKTGKELWVTKIDAGAHSAPITFQGKNGKQYVVVTATGGGFLGDRSRADTIIAYALP